MTKHLSFNSSANTNQNNAKGFNPHLFDFQSHKVRVVTDEYGNPWFVAKDVCEVLDHTSSTRAVEGLDDDEKGVRKVQSLGGNQETNVVSESGLYTLIIRSNKPNAKKFRKWVTSEVLPSIRKTGGYRVPETLFNKMADLLGETTHALKAVHAENKAVHAQNQIIEAEKKDMAPKAAFYNQYRETRGKHGLQATAKILGLKPNTFIKELLADGLLFRRDECLTAPESLLKQGLFTTRLFENPSTRMPCHQTMVTPKGLVELAMRYGRRDDLRSRPQDAC